MHTCSKCQRVTDPYAGGPLPSDGYILCGYCADELNEELASLLRAFVGKHPREERRWPCQSCGRTGPSEPLRLLGYAQETAPRERPTKVTYWTGCDPCNRDDLVLAAKAALSRRRT